MNANQKVLFHALERLRQSNLYVNNDVAPGLSFAEEELKEREVYLLETLSVINALVSQGAMLLYGGHGVGKTTFSKYLGQILYGFDTFQIESCLLRAHPQLTEEKIVGSLDIAQLAGKKELNSNQSIDVIWSDFVLSPWKIVDEVNRMSPFTQNILLSLLSEGSVKYHNETKILDDFTLFATMNPKDESNFSLSLSFLDRFALALPVRLPDAFAWSGIGISDTKTAQNRLHLFAETFDMEQAKEELDSVSFSDSAENFLNFLLHSYNSCIVANKELDYSLHVDNGLCSNCHFNMTQKACNKVRQPLSIRVKQDLYKYAKALAWFLGAKEVLPLHVKFLSPYMLWHRSVLSSKYKNEVRSKRLHKEKVVTELDFEATKDLIDVIWEEFKALALVLDRFEKAKVGSLPYDELRSLFIEVNNTSKYNTKIVMYEMKPFLTEIYQGDKYQRLYDLNQRISQSKTISSLKNISEEIVCTHGLKNKHLFDRLIKRKRAYIAQQLYKSEVYYLPYEVIEELINDELPDLQRRIGIKQKKNSFQWNKKQKVYDISEDECHLIISKVKGTHEKPLWKFEYSGPLNTVLHTFLKKNDVGFQ